MKNIIELVIDDLTRRGYFINPSKMKASILNSIRNYQLIAEEHDKNVWNEAIEAAAENATTIWGQSVIKVDKQSILKLKK